PPAPVGNLRARGAETDVARSGRAVGRHRQAAGRRRHDGLGRIEDKQHLVATAKEDMAHFLPGDPLEADHGAIEGLCGVEIVGIEDGFENCGRCHDLYGLSVTVWDRSHCACETANQSTAAVFRSRPTGWCDGTRRSRVLAGLRTAETMTSSS